LHDYPDIRLRTEEPRRFAPRDDIPREKYAAKNVADNLSNVISHLYVFESAGNFLRESANLSEYDFVVISRTDLWIRKFPSLDTLPAGFYTTSEHPHFPDLIFILSPSYFGFTKVFENISRAEWEDIPNFIPELLKRSSFRVEFPGVSPISLPADLLDVQIVRSHSRLVTLMRNWRGVPRYVLRILRNFRRGMKGK